MYATIVGMAQLIHLPNCNVSECQNFPLYAVFRPLPEVSQHAAFQWNFHAPSNMSLDDTVTTNFLSHCIWSILHESYEFMHSTHTMEYYFTVYHTETA